MRFALLVARTRGSIRRLLRDKRGISAVEFAMLLPLMVTLYLGCVEASTGIAIDRKVTLVARSLGDLVAQASTITNDEMTNILNASAAVVQPYQDSDTVEEPWVVTSFDEWTLLGKVSNGREVLAFHSTSFQASTHRWPRVGEPVEVVFNAAGNLLAVHGK